MPRDLRGTPRQLNECHSLIGGETRSVLHRNDYFALPGDPASVVDCESLVMVRGVAGGRVFCKAANRLVALADAASSRMQDSAAMDPAAQDPTAAHDAMDAVTALDATGAQDAVVQAAQEDKSAA